MCGICGLALPEREAPAEPLMLQRMTDSLRHRGPDGEGHWMGPGVGLGVRRLSIIDVEHGQQPILSEDGNVALVCNGEIYNAPELRHELRARGHRFQGGSDVEVIVHLYEEFGDACLERLRGVFAFALWDAGREALLLARDRLGVKPLYYAIGDGGDLQFGSEAKAILAAGTLDAKVEPRGLFDALVFGGPLFDRTLFAGIRQLEPGCWLRYQRGEVTTRRYWDLEFGDARAVPGSDTEWAEAFAAKLEEAVRIRLRSDVPLASWLSPGIDSSAVAGLADRELPAGLRAFVLGFEDPVADELAGRPTLDSFPGFDISGRVVTYRDRDAARIARAVWHLEQPAGLHLAELVLADATSDEGFKVVLTGQGSDEMLGGYHWYAQEKRWGRVAGVPLVARRLLSTATLLPWWRPHTQRLLTLPGPMGLARFAGLAGARRLETVRPLLSPWLASALPTPEQTEQELRPPDSFPSWGRFEQLQYIELKTRLASYINRGLDAASMAHSLEARLPFLDHELAELCASAPTDVKLRGSQEKFLLRRAMKGLLPPAIVQRRKRGLQNPVAFAWLQRERSDLVDTLLSERALADKGYFDPAAVSRLERSGPSRASQTAWTTLLGIQLWDEIFVQGRGPDLGVS